MNTLIDIGQMWSCGGEKTLLNLHREKVESILNWARDEGIDLSTEQPFFYLYEFRNTYGGKTAMLCLGVSLVALSVNK